MVKPPKLKRAEIAQLGNLMSALSLISDTAAAAKEFARTVQTSADAQITEHRTLMQRHLDRKDLRPHVIFRPGPKNTWTVAFNSETYSLGPYDPLPTDEDEMAYWWMTPDGTKRPCRSAFQALIAVVQDYCNAEEPDEPVDDPATGPVANQ